MSDKENLPQPSPQKSSAKPVHPRKLFYQRMEREGRSKKFQARVKEIQTLTGKLWGQARDMVMKEPEWGYSAKTERKLHEEYLANLHKTSAQQEMDKIRDEIREERKLENFEDALASIPAATASRQVEIDWIRAHPAMTRKDRQSDKTKPVLIDANDILYAKHGPAPSRAAVQALQHWVNLPHEFHKQLLAEYKKSVEEQQAREAVADTGLSEIERLLKEVEDATREPDRAVSQSDAGPDDSEGE